MAKLPEPFEEVVRVALKQEHDLEELKRGAKDIASETQAVAARAEALLRRLNVEPTRHDLDGPRVASALLPVALRSWEEVLADAVGIDADMDALLPAEERDAVLARFRAVGDAAVAKTQMDWADCVVAGLAAALAGIVDVLLVQVPRHPGFLGSPAHEGGWLSNLVKEKFGDLLPPASIRQLERDFRVPFDPATSRGLEEYIDGLGPRTHRFHSFGHDPILAWTFGVADVLRGTFTAVDKFGRLVCQTSPGAGAIDPGLGLFEAVLEAFRRVFGHLLSDVATPAGLPAPLMPLALFVQTGLIGPRGYTVSEVARQMYRSGFDFRHFLAGSISTVLVEIVVRGAWVVRRLHEGAELADIVPKAGHPRLRKTLLLAHAGAAAVNAGKVHFTGPLALNWSQWLALSCYAARETGALLTGESGNRRHAAVERALANDWNVLSDQIHNTWAASGAIVGGTCI